MDILDVAYISSDKIILEDGFSQLNQIIAMNLGVEMCIRDSYYYGTDEKIPSLLVNTYGGYKSVRKKDILSS